MLEKKGLKINNHNFYLKELEKEGQNKCKRNKIIKTPTEIN